MGRAAVFTGDSSSTKRDDDLARGLNDLGLSDAFFCGHSARAPAIRDKQSESRRLWHNIGLHDAPVRRRCSSRPNPIYPGGSDQDRERGCNRDDPPSAHRPHGAPARREGLGTHSCLTLRLRPRFRCPGMADKSRQRTEMAAKSRHQFRAGELAVASLVVLDAVEVDGFADAFEVGAAAVDEGEVLAERQLAHDVGDEDLAAEALIADARRDRHD
jgi:hypothetical protein